MSVLFRIRNMFACELFMVSLTTRTEFQATIRLQTVQYFLSQLIPILNQLQVTEVSALLTLACLSEVLALILSVSHQLHKPLQSQQTLTVGIG